MTELLAQTIKKIIAEQISENEETIQNILLSGTDDTMCSEKIFSLMILNSVSLSVNMSVQLITELLTNAGIIDVADEEHLRKILLSSVKK